jgi:hypothetical protein
MAQAAFFVNDLKIVDKGDCLLLEARRRCQHGKIIARIYLAFPAELRHVFAECARTPAKDMTQSDTGLRDAWRHRLDEYFNRGN